MVSAPRLRVKRRWSAWWSIFLSSARVLAGVFSGSQGLIADGIHSLSDLVADFVVLLANKKSGKPSDSDHHYGHRRYENGASLVIGALLLLVGAGMLWSACGKLLHPASIPSVHITALWVALAALTAKEMLFRYMLRAAKQIQSSMLIANAWHARSDAASSVVVAVGIIGNPPASPGSIRWPRWPSARWSPAWAIPFRMTPSMT